jgi:uncharacterized protein (DUF1330 family)
MPAYVVVDIDLSDPDQLAAYREAAPATLEAGGGKYLARGGALTVLEGDWSPDRLTVVEFPDVESAKAWYDSEGYRAARELRKDAPPFKMVIVDGL